MWQTIVVGLAPLTLLAPLPQETDVGSPKPAVLTSEPSPQRALASLEHLIPAESLAGFLWNDPSGLFERREKSAFWKFFSDPRLLQSMDISAEDMLDVAKDLPAIQKMIAGAEQVAVWAEPSKDEWLDFPMIATCIRGNQECLDAAISLASDATEREFDGVTYWQTEGATGTRTANEVLFVGDSDFDLCVEVLTQMKQRLAGASDTDGEETSNLFALNGIAEQRTASDVEIAFNLEWLVEEIEMDLGGGDDESLEIVIDEVRGIRWFYASGVFGEGMQSEWVLTLPMVENGHLYNLSSHFTACELSAYERIPKAAISCGAMNFDMAGFADSIIEIASEIFPEAEDEYLMAVEQVKTALGFDIQADLIENFKGTILTFVAPGSAMSTVIFDANDPSTLVEVFESLVMTAQSSGAGDFLSETVVDWGDAWSFAMEDVFDILFGVDNSSLVFSMDSTLLDAYMQLQEEPSKENSILAHKVVSELAGDFTETPGMLAHIPSFFGSMHEMFLADPEFSDDSDLEEITDFIAGIQEIVDDHLDGWLGYSMEVHSNHLRFELKTR